VPLWEEILVGWIGMFLLPKLVVVPVWRAMWRSMRATERLDELDRAWLSSRSLVSDDDDLEPPRRVWRPRSPQPRSDGRGPLRRLARRRAGRVRSHG
jgi:hypothetical protein